MGGWSPEIISNHLKINPQFPSISQEAIYQWIYKEAPHLIDSLVRHHPKRWKKGQRHRKRHHFIPQRVSIHERPKNINQRQEAGHWETDLLIGSGTSALQVTVERKSRLSRLKKIHHKTPAASRQALLDSLSAYPSAMRRSITYDNGFENREHHFLNQELGTRSYFCEPYHSWEKGTVENTNGLIRRFFPKRTNFDTLSEQQILEVESWLNNRPRKCLNFNTPLESFSNLCVALTP
jgi:IS30 family transposase